MSLEEIYKHEGELVTVRLYSATPVTLDTIVTDLMETLSDELMDYISDGLAPDNLRDITEIALALLQVHHESNGVEIPKGLYLSAVVEYGKNVDYSDTNVDINGNFYVNDGTPSPIY